MQPFLEPDSPRARSAIEANQVEHLTYLARTLPGAIVKDSPALLLVDSGLPCNTFNIVCRARLARHDADAHIAAAISHFRDRSFPFTWWVGPDAAPEDLGARLSAHGLVYAEQELGMTLDLSRLPALSPPPGLRIRRAEDEHTLADFARVVAANWEPADPHVLDVYARTAHVALAPDSPIRFYVGYLDGEAVAASECHRACGVAGLYSVATLRHARRRGIGAALTLAPLLDAREAGYRTAILQASSQGQGVYSRLGFVPNGTFREYQ